MELTPMHIENITDTVTWFHANPAAERHWKSISGYLHHNYPKRGFTSRGEMQAMVKYAEKLYNRMKILSE